MMPRRPPVDPSGIYHVGSRGVYGRTLWEDVGQHERFLFLFRRVVRKHALVVLEWTLVKNHHHAVIGLTDGGLSEAMRELHGGYSRWFHAIHEETRKGHLFRHAFFARPLRDDADVIGTCAYVSSNLLEFRDEPLPRRGDWAGYGAIIGIEHAREFHSPQALLALIDGRPDRARAIYHQYVAESHARRRQGHSPNDMPEPG